MRVTSSQLQFINAHEKEDVHALALRYSGEDLPWLLTQIAGRQRAREKIPSWYRREGIIYPAHLSLEQASSEVTARYKGSLLPDRKVRFADLTGGMGVDFSFLAPHFTHALYLEQDRELCRLASHNFDQLGVKHGEVQNGQSELFLPEMEHADMIYLDPARRDEGGRKVFRIEDCRPDLTELQELLLEKADRVMIKFSPMLDISLAVRTLGEVSEVHVVSVENECKELLFLLTRGAGTCLYHAVNLHRDGEQEMFRFTRGDEAAEALVTAHPGKYLYEPNAAILKAGAFHAVGNRYQLYKLHKHSHLYTSEKLMADFPGRIFTIEEVMIPHKRNIRHLRSQREKANITVRNFPMSVAEIRRRSGIKEGGDTHIFATTLADSRKVWIVGTRFNPKS